MAFSSNTLFNATCVKPRLRALSMQKWYTIFVSDKLNLKREWKIPSNLDGRIFGSRLCFAYICEKSTNVHHFLDKVSILIPFSAARFYFRQGEKLAARYQGSTIIKWVQGCSPSDALKWVTCALFIFSLSCTGVQKVRSKKAYCTACYPVADSLCKTHSQAMQRQVRCRWPVCNALDSHASPGNLLMRAPPPLLRGSPLMRGTGVAHEGGRGPPHEASSHF